MRQSSSISYYLALRRRARPAALCLVILLLISASLFKTYPSSYLAGYGESTTDQLLSDHLFSSITWTRESSPLQTQDQERLDADAQLIDKIPDIPPTLLEDEDSSDDSNFNFGTVKAAHRYSGHAYEKNGLLIVNPDAPHPIYELVRDAKAQWAAKLEGASKTLDQAVKEYRRRYNRLPPKGFDKWWEYVQKHNVQLPDEYDQINRDLEPYWGIDPEDLQLAQLEREGMSDSFTIGKLEEDGVITLVNMTVDDSRKHRALDYMSWGVRPQLELLTDVYQHIPQFRATLSPSDGPSLLADWTWRSAAVEAAKKGTYLKPEDLPPQESTGWSGACPPDSPLHLNPPKRDEEPTRQALKTFIHDHRASMDPCYHPQHTLLHGTFLSHHTGPKPHRFTAPLLSNCASSLNTDIRATSMAQSSEFAHEDPRWEDKVDDRLFWRGTPTGMFHRTGLNWRSSHRVRLVNITGASRTGQIIESSADSYVSFLDPTRDPDEPVGEASRHARRRVNRALMDVSFSGPVTGCENTTVCDAMRSQLAWSDRVPSNKEGAGRYKFVLDIDGNGWSSRFRRLMSSHALVFKSTLYPEWWTDRAQAWVHYVPVQLDYSDLYDSLVFFGGDLGGEGAHEEIAREIASAGREWVEKFWRKEDVTAYMFRLWLEYARVMSLDRDAMSFHPPGQG